jgi:hypothetical protein
MATEQYSNPHFRPVRSPLTTEGLAGTIYGTVTSMAVIAAVSEYKSNTVQVVGSTVLTVFALTLAHGYANWIGMRPGGQSHSDFRLVVTHEWPILASSIVMGLALVVPRVLGVSETTAIDISLWFGTGMLFFLGFRAAQRSGRLLKSCVLLATFDALIGVMVVVIKAAVH